MADSNKKIIISIEGNIGAGKTSLMDLLKGKLNDKIEFIYEPIDEWSKIKDEKGNDILSIFYGDKKRWCYTFQNIAYITRMTCIIDKIKNSDKKYIILDRSLAADLNISAKMLYETKFMTLLEWNAYNQWNNFFITNFGNLIEHKFIYLKCDPTICFNRIKKRNRDAEKDISIDYILLLNKYLDDWLLNEKNILLLDTNNDYIENKIIFNQIYEKICKFLNI